MIDNSVFASGAIEVWIRRHAPVFPLLYRMFVYLWHQRLSHYISGNGEDIFIALAKVSGGLHRASTCLQIWVTSPA